MIAGLPIGFAQPLVLIGIDTLSVTVMRSPRSGIVATTFPFPTISR